MSVSNIMPEGTYLGITFGMLAGGKELNGLPTYRAIVDKKDNDVKSLIKEEGIDCTCNSIVLGLLAIIAAAGAATLIAFSGGPVNLQIFVPGVVLGAVTFGLTIGLIVEIARSIKDRQTKKKKFIEVAEAKISNEKLLSELEKPDVTSEQITIAMENFSHEQRKDFMIWTHNQYFPVKDPNSPDQGAKSLTAENKKVLAAFAAFPSALMDLKSDSFSREFALEMLAKIDPAVITKKGKDFDGKNLLLALFAKAQASKDKAEAQVFARHPIAIAGLAQTNPEIFTPQVVSDIYAQMDVEQKTAFLKQMADALAALKADKNNPKIDQQQTIIAAVKECFVDASFTKEFIEQFKPIDGESSKERNEKYAKAKELLKQIGRFPFHAAERIYLTKDSLAGHGDLIKALYDVMEQADKDGFVNFAAEQLNKQECEPSRWINAYAKDNAILPDATRKIYAKAPVAMGYAMNKLNNKDSANRATQLANEIVNSMTRDNRILFLEAEKVVNPSGFEAHMIVALKALHENIKSGQVVWKENITVAYFKQHPEDFKKLVIDNLKKDLNGERFKLALHILDQMDDVGEKVIAQLDTTGGYENYNACLAILKDQAKDPKISNERTLLIARFKYAPQNGQSVWLGKNALDTSGEEWKDFITIAKKNKIAVWKKVEKK